MNLCLLRDENLTNEQRSALNQLTINELKFSIDEHFYPQPEPDYNKYHQAEFELQQEANRIAKLLQRARRAAKDEKAGRNHLIEEGKRELKAKIKSKQKDLEQLKEQLGGRSSKRSRK